MRVESVGQAARDLLAVGHAVEVVDGVAVRILHSPGDPCEAVERSTKDARLQACVVGDIVMTCRAGFDLRSGLSCNPLTTRVLHDLDDIVGLNLEPVRV